MNFRELWIWTLLRDLLETLKVHFWIFCLEFYVSETQYFCQIKTTVFFGSFLILSFVLFHSVGDGFRHVRILEKKFITTWVFLTTNRKSIIFFYSLDLVFYKPLNHIWEMTGKIYWKNRYCLEYLFFLLFCSVVNACYVRYRCFRYRSISWYFCSNFSTLLNYLWEIHIQRKIQ